MRFTYRCGLLQDRTPVCVWGGGGGGGVMHRHVTRDRFHADPRRFTEAIFRFFDETLPREWEAIAESVTGSFRVVTHDGHRMAG